MTLRKILAPILALALLLSAALVFATPAYAACNYNGYINSNGKCSVSYRNTPAYPFAYQYQFQNRFYQDRDEYLRSVINYLQDLIKQLENQIEDNRYSVDSNVSVSTQSATDVEDDRATLRGRVYTGREDEVTVYFEYGRSRNSLDDETSHRVIENPSATYNFSTTLRDLNDDTVYYYRAVAEDERGDEDYGSVYSFRTDEGRTSRYDDEPDLDTRSASSITDDSAYLRGIVDMNDFENGLVFFVYGEDRSQIEDVEDDYDQYADVDENGDNLQKVKVDSSLDGSSSYTEKVSGLDSNTRIYFSICVEYEDEDGDDVIGCGDTESFDTDR